MKSLVPLWPKEIKMKAICVTDNVNWNYGMSPSPPTRRTVIF
jgi:hypothetical protein